MPKDDNFLETNAFTLAFKVDGKIVRSFKPRNVDIEETEENDKTYYTIKLQFNPDLGRSRKEIIGASRLEFSLIPNPANMVT